MDIYKLLSAVSYEDNCCKKEVVPYTDTEATKLSSTESTYKILFLSYSSKEWKTTQKGSIIDVQWKSLSDLKVTPSQWVIVGQHSFQKMKNRSLCDKSTKIGIHVEDDTTSLKFRTLQLLNYKRHTQCSLHAFNDAATRLIFVLTCPKFLLYRMAEGIIGELWRNGHGLTSN